MTLHEVLEKKRETLLRKIEERDERIYHLEERMRLIEMIANTDNAIDFENIYSCITSLVGR